LFLKALKGRNIIAQGNALGNLSEQNRTFGANSEMRDLLARLKAGHILLSDGAMGTSLQEMGLGPGDCPEEWNLSHPRQVEEIISRYIAAGSDMVLTNSFGGSPLKLAKFGLDAQTERINRAAAEIARRAAGDEHLVLGSVGPTGEFMEPLGSQTAQSMYEAFRRQMVALAQGGADAICIETMSALEEALAALRAAKENTSIPVIVTLTFNKTSKGEFRTMMGVSPQQAVQQLTQAGADIVGSNCGTGIEVMVEIARQIRNCTDKFIMIQPNAGLPVLEDGKTVFKDTPEMMARYVPALVDSGVSIIGGCCGTTPAHIAALREKIDNLLGNG